MFKFLHKIIKEFEPYLSSATSLKQAGVGMSALGAYLAWTNPIVELLGLPLSLMLGAVIGMLVFFSISVLWEKKFGQKTKVSSSLNDKYALNNQETSLAFKLITRSSTNEVDFALIDDGRTKNVFKHQSFPFLTISNLGKCFDVILELNSPFLPNALVNVMPSNNKLHPKFNTIYAGKYAIMVRIWVDTDLDINGGEYKISIKSYES